MANELCFAGLAFRCKVVLCGTAAPLPGGLLQGPRQHLVVPAAGISDPEAMGRHSVAWELASGILDDSPLLPDADQYQEELLRIRLPSSVGGVTIGISPRACSHEARQE